MAIAFDHSVNTATIEGPRVALRQLFRGRPPASVLDVGCGGGAWLKAAREAGVGDLFGIDGVDLGDDRLIPRSCFQQVDLRTRWRLGRTFDAAFCLEVAEHLEPEYADPLIDALTEHAATIYFSAACPRQEGQHHVNGQWPAYWQERFNRRQYTCVDTFRWQVWDETRIEPWYRQNLFVAMYSPATAGTEPRIRAVVHPAMLGLLQYELKRAEDGGYPLSWYLKQTRQAAGVRLRRRLHPRAGAEAS